MATMLCPACLAFGMEVPTATTVNGTQYCANHGVEALSGPLSRLRSPGPQRANQPDTPTLRARGAFSRPPGAPDDTPKVRPAKQLEDGAE